MENGGTFALGGTGDILAGGGAVFNNQVGATFDARTNDGEDIEYRGAYVSGGVTTFNNNGAVIKTGDGSTATLFVCYNGTPPVGVVVNGSCP